MQHASKFSSSLRTVMMIVPIERPERCIFVVRPTERICKAAISEGGLYFINPYPTAFPYGNGMVLHFYQQQESSTTKTVHKVINKGLKTYV